MSIDRGAPGGSSDTVGFSPILYIILYFSVDPMLLLTLGMANPFNPIRKKSCCPYSLQRYVLT